MPAASSRDEQHRVKNVKYPASGGRAAFDVSVKYDEFGRTSEMTDLQGMTTVRYDSLSRPSVITPPSPQKALTHSYFRDTTLQRWTSTVTLAGIGDYTYREDSKGRLSQILNPFSQLTTLEHDKDGNQTVLTHANGAKEERTYTARDWLASITFRKADGTVHDYLDYFYTDAALVYDPTGHVRREVDKAGKTHAFFYDNLYRLTKETHTDFGEVLYGHDLNGNRTSKTLAAGTDYYGVDARDKLLWVNRGTNAAPTSGQANPYTLFTHDANGRTTRRERKHDDGIIRTHDLFWDGDDRLREVKQGAASRMSAGYSGDGLRVQKTDAWAGARDYSWGPGGVLYDSFQTTIRTPGVAQRRNGADRYFWTDSRGSTRHLTSTGNTITQSRWYDSFGNQANTTGTDGRGTDFLFAGAWGYQTEFNWGTEPGIGLQYLQQRYYDPVVGRFLTPDPIGWAGGLNLYAYVGNDPVNEVDPDGLRAVRGRDSNGELITLWQDSNNQWWYSDIGQKLEVMEGEMTPFERMLSRALEAGVFGMMSPPTVGRQFGGGVGFIRPMGPARQPPCPPGTVGRGGPINRIYSARELIRRSQEVRKATGRPGPYHNFPGSFDQEIFRVGSRTVAPGYWKTEKSGYSRDSIQYRLRGNLNGVDGTYEIFVRPSLSGRTELITHRFFNPKDR